jgi:hypothetical protein
MKNKTNIISGSYPKRFESSLNHKLYADKQNYKYVCDNSKYEISSVYDHKLMSITNLPIDDEWWMWIDDDAFFMQPNKPIDISDHDQSLFVFPKSPINPNGDWTFISSGNFFFKNTKVVQEFFAKCLDTNLDVVKKWWGEELGMFTNGDQDKIVYELFQTGLINSTSIVGWELFNARPYHFKNVNDYFLVHFTTPGISKQDSILDFQKRFKFKDQSLTR